MIKTRSSYSDIDIAYVEPSITVYAASVIVNRLLTVGSSTDT